MNKSSTQKCLQNLTGNARSDFPDVRKIGIDISQVRQRTAPHSLVPSMPLWYRGTAGCIIAPSSGEGKGRGWGKIRNGTRIKTTHSNTIETVKRHTVNIKETGGIRACMAETPHCFKQFIFSGRPENHYNQKIRGYRENV